MKVAICGYGWVGKAMHQLFPEAYLYDPVLGYGEKEEVNKRDVAFICVPTPNNTKVVRDKSLDRITLEDGEIKGYDLIGEGKLDTSIVEEVVGWCTCPLLVIRSTVNPGTCDELVERYSYKKHIVMQPEYLGETVNHPMTDQKERPFMIIGGDPADRRTLIELYQTIYNAHITIRQMSAYEAEVVKLSENRAIAFKVSQCQELYDVCELAEIDYYTIREAVYGDDPRFNLWWSFVFLDKRGANSKCIPKDVFAWCAWAESLGYQPKITRAILEKNKEWLKLNDRPLDIDPGKK